MTALPKGELRVCAPLYRRIPRRRKAVRPYNRLPYPHFALVLSFRASDRRHWRGNPFPFHVNQRPKAATYLCRFAAKARFDNRHPPRGEVSKGEGSQPLPFGRFKGKRFLRKGGNRNPPFLKPFFGYFLSGKKVTRRRQKRERKAIGRGRAPPLRTSPESPCIIRAGRCGHRPLRTVYRKRMRIPPGGQRRPPLQGPKKHPAGGKKNKNHGQSPTPTP